MFGLDQLTSRRNWRDFGRLFRNRRYDLNEVGELIIGGARIGGNFLVKGEGGLWVPGKNTGTTEGWNYILLCMAGTTVPSTSWYIAPYTANWTPTIASTAATFHSTALEETTGYSETTRQAYASSSPAAGSINNYASPAVFTATGAVVWYGFGLFNTSTKDDASAYPTQAMIAAAKFTSAESLSGSGSQLGIKYRYYIEAAA